MTTPTNEGDASERKNDTIESDRQTAWDCEYIMARGESVPIFARHWIKTGDASEAPEVSRAVKRIAQALADERAKVTACCVATLTIKTGDAALSVAQEQYQAMASDLIKSFRANAAVGQDVERCTGFATHLGPRGCECILQDQHEGDHRGWANNKLVSFPRGHRDNSSGSAGSVSGTRQEAEAATPNASAEAELGRAAASDEKLTVCGCEESRSLRRQLNEVDKINQRLDDARVRWAKAREEAVAETAAERARTADLREAWKVAKNDANRFERAVERVEMTNARLTMYLENVREAFGKPGHDGGFAGLAALAREAAQHECNGPNFAEAEDIFNKLIAVFRDAGHGTVHPLRFATVLQKLFSEREFDRRKVVRLEDMLREQGVSHEAHRRAMAEQADEWHNTRRDLANMALAGAAEKLAKFAVEQADSLKRFAENEIRGAR